jgi:hypothetical protein
MRSSIELANSGTLIESVNNITHSDDLTITHSVREKQFPTLKNSMVVKQSLQFTQLSDNL